MDLALLATGRKLWWGHECPTNAIKQTVPVTTMLGK